MYMLESKENNDVIKDKQEQETVENEEKKPAYINRDFTYIW